MLHQRDVNHAYKVPAWPELAVKMIWPYAVQFPDFRTYIPDEWEGGIRGDRPFFYTILQTIAPEYVSALINQCSELRAQRKSKAQLGTNLTSIQPHFINPLLEGNFVSRGKSAHSYF